MKLALLGILAALLLAWWLTLRRALTDEMVDEYEAWRFV
jgi:hypothetical protein